MNQIIKTLPAIAIPNFLEPANARNTLEAKIRAFVASAACVPHAAADEPAAALALRVTPGAGKTSATLRAIATHADQLLSRGHVLMYLPTLHLAERTANDFRAISPKVPSAVLRGREAARPGAPNETMCSRLNLVKKLSGLVPSITQAICRARNDEGEIVGAPCAIGCPYLNQRHFTRAHVIFLPHAYLETRPPFGPEIPVALRVIDEKCWTTLTRTVSTTVEEFMRLSGALDSTLQADHRKAVRTILDALQSRIPVLAALAGEGIFSDRLSQLAAAESAARPRLNIRPWEDDLIAYRRLDLFNAATFTASINRQFIFELLAECNAPSCNRLSFGAVSGGDSDQKSIKMHKLARLPRDAPLLMLDADADPEITKRLAPGCEFASIDMQPTVEVIQIRDRTLSNSWLLDQAEGPARRRKILDLVTTEVDIAKGRGVLLVATKPVLRELHADVGNTIGIGSVADLLQPLLGASPRWIGPSTQGINDFEDYATAIIVGRLQPRPGDVEDIARCIFGDDLKPIEEHTGGPLPEHAAAWVLANGHMVDTRVSIHPDTRAHAVLQQIRECGSMQAAGRIRPIAPKRPKRMLILSKIPLPGLPVTTLLSFEAACHGLTDEIDPTGFLRLEAAFSAVKDKAVFGSRLSASGLAEDLPRDFPTRNSGSEFRRSRSTPNLFALIKRIAAKHKWNITLLELRRPQGGTPIPAVIFCAASHAEKLAAKFWPGFLVTTMEKDQNSPPQSQK